MSESKETVPDVAPFTIRELNPSYQTPKWFAILSVGWTVVRLIAFIAPLSFFTSSVCASSTLWMTFIINAFVQSLATSILFYFLVRRLLRTSYHTRYYFVKNTIASVITFSWLIFIGLFIVFPMTCESMFTSHVDYYSIMTFMSNVVEIFCVFPLRVNQLYIIEKLKVVRTLQHIESANDVNET